METTNTQTSQILISETKEVYKDGLIINVKPYYKDGTKYHLIIYWGRSLKPVVNGLCSSEIGLNKVIADYKQRYDEHVKRKEEKKAEVKAFKPSLKIGDILYSSWGYDQTNIDFYQVVEVKGKMVRIKAICNNTKEDGFMCGKTTAVKDAFVTGNLAYDKWHKVLVGNCVKITSYAHAHLYDGRELYKSWYA